MYGSIQTLITLDLAGNEIHDLGAQYLAHALEQNTVRLVLYPYCSYKYVWCDTDTYHIGSCWK